MLETRAVVVQLLEKPFVLVQSSQGGGCGQCGGKGCGASKLSQMFCSKPRQFKVDNRINARVGDEVVVSVMEGAVLHSIGLVYLLPLVLLFAGAALAGSFAVQEVQRDGYAALGALSGLIVGFIFAKWIAARQIEQQNQPYIARQSCE
ncbi:MAG: Fis family transcriptional regulator [Gallionellales bacterium CG03_land_8_20_14_0_80_55_15]|nr:MAG: Fis family transcriptional regulator [Gallionellales bacterium CG03_land_8_20_14_0_80_55_15]PIX04584.1 MAG: Fis family transcriptional regulator [Gallionellales bacterium CG_4_8_14_3_um_filter_54_18]PJC03115.1 MAG: Fis family transcriptional regulator [Gallionellales bacterium CG_4_9_14_0_8_um_filter_55_61]HCJ51947.1 Fis family transcriptional regulator [Gallionella sp.]